MTTTTDPITTFCNALMRAVVATGAVTKANAGQAVEIMREEAKAFIAGDKYADERACLAAGTLPERVIFARVATECVSRLV